MKDIQSAIISNINEAGVVIKRKRKMDDLIYKDIVCAFDIETSRLEDDQAIMYIWQFEAEGLTMIGRTWEEWLRFMEDVSEALPEGARLLVWVHNLSYEFSFLKGIMQFDDVFMVRPRKVLYAISGKIEFRCSYLLSNMSLEKFLEQMQVENKKLSYDYDKVRYPWTMLNEAELAYCVNDVKGLCQAIRKRLDLDGDTLATIPYTSTGYIRRDAKREYGKTSYQYRRSIMPTLGLYRLLRSAFRGGNSHANRWIVGLICKDVFSFDRASSYPDVMVTCPFPVSSFYHKGPVDMETFENLLAMPKAIIMKVILTNIELKDAHYPIPYIARHKCEEIEKPIIDNGRIISADRIVCSITDIDYKIINYQYSFDMFIDDLYYARYGPLKQGIKDLIIRDYGLKTSLKGGDKQYDYARSKERVNAYY